MRSRVPAALPGVLLLALLAVAGCSDVVGPPEVLPEPTTNTVRNARFDPRLEPAEAVMAVVPDSATSLRVTDYDLVRGDLAPSDVTILTDEVLGEPDVLHDDYGFGIGDVAWEAEWTGPDGDGWAVGLHADVAAKGPTDAVAAGAGGLGGATYYPTTHVLLEGGTLDPQASWGADRSLTSLVGQPASSTFVQRDCVPLDVAFAPGLVSSLSDASAAEIATLAALPAFSVTFGQDLATVRLGEGRDDVVTRSRLADHLPRTDPEFGLGFTHPVADDDTGRIGYLVGDPAIASRLVRTDQLPFGLCSSAQS